MSDARAALEAIGQLPDAEIDLADAAVQLARIDAPQADWHAAQDHLSLLARDAVEMAGELSEDDLAGRLRVLATLMGARHRYGGDVDTYDDPRNANLIRVIERRRGLPVALGILWLHAARAAGWEAEGLDFPGHFLLALPVPGDTHGSKVLLDPFAGGTTVDTRGFKRLLRAVEGPLAQPRPELLDAMSNRGILLRLQNNILLRRMTAGEILGALACCEDMLRIAPEVPGLWHQAGLLNRQAERPAAAVDCLEHFLHLAPSGEAADQARTTLAELRAGLH